MTSDRSVVDVVDQMIAAIPETEDLRKDLERMRGEMFLVLPETARWYWGHAAEILNRHISRGWPGVQPEWVAQVCIIWFGKQSDL